MPYVRYKFESNSQQCEHGAQLFHRCICHMLDTSLKAIHNIPIGAVLTILDVYAIC